MLLSRPQVSLIIHCDCQEELQGLKRKLQELTEQNDQLVKAGEACAHSLCVCVVIAASARLLGL